MDEMDLEEDQRVGIIPREWGIHNSIHFISS